MRGVEEVFPGEMFHVKHKDWAVILGISGMFHVKQEQPVERTAIRRAKPKRFRLISRLLNRYGPQQVGPLDGVYLLRYDGSGPITRQIGILEGGGGSQWLR